MPRSAGDKVPATPSPPSVRKDPAPAPAPPAAPAPRLAPEGVYFVVKYFAISTDSGVHGFTPGMAVRLVRKDGNSLVVTDGRLRVRASAANFTRDLAVRDALLAGSSSASRPAPPLVATPTLTSPAPAVPSPAASPAAKVLSLAERKVARAAAETAANRNKRIDQLREEISDLDKRIPAAEAELQSRGSKQAANPRHYTYDAYGRAVLYQGTYVVTYSADATGIEQLRRDRDRLKKRLADLSAP